MSRDGLRFAFGLAVGVLLSGAAVAQMHPAEAAATATENLEVNARIRNDVLHTLAIELESRYAIPETAEKLAALVRAKQKENAYGRFSNAAEFARALSDDLFAVAHDKHLHVDFGFAPFPSAPGGAPPPEVLEQIRRGNGGIPKLEILDGNVGYMRVDGVPFVAGARTAIAASFAFLHNTDALIIDDRGNGGGDPNTVALYVSYLSEGPPFVVNTFHWREGNRVEEFHTTDLGELGYGVRKPVFVLTSPRTFSGGEELAYDLQALKRGVVVGEATGGGANPGGLVPIGHGFTVFLPTGQGINPLTGTNWEGVGVKPDVATESSAALFKAHKLAIERLRDSATDAWSRSMLDSVAMKMQSIQEMEVGNSTRLDNAQVLGSYAPEIGRGTTVMIVEKDGKLIRQVAGVPDRPLIYVGGNRYRLEGLPDGFALSFRVTPVKAELLLEDPMGPSVIRVRQ